MTSIEAAREFLMSRAGSFPEDPHPTVIELAAFADQISEQRVKAERERLYKSFEQRIDLNDRELWISVRAWRDEEFAAEIGGTDADMS